MINAKTSQPHRNLIVFFVLAIAMIFFSLPCMATSQKSYFFSLNEAVALAIKNQKHILTSKEKTTMAKGETHQALASFLPQISAEALQKRTFQENLAARGYSTNNMQTLIGPFNTFDARLYLAQTLIDFYNLNNYKAAKTKWESTKLNEVVVRRSVINQVLLFYLNALNCRARVKVDRYNLKQARQLFTLSTDQYRAGFATKIDVTRSEALIAQEKLALEQSLFTQETADIRLILLTGLSFDKNLKLMQFASFLTHTLPDTNEATQKALEQRVEIKIAQLELQMTQENLRAQKSKRLPTISAVMDVGYSGDLPDSSSKTVGTAAVQLHLPLFEGGQIQGGIEKAQSYHNINKINQENLLREIKADVLLAIKQLKSTKQQIQTSKTARVLAEKEFNLAYDSFKSGLGNAVVLVDAQTTLATAKQNEILAQTDLQKAWVNYYNAVGDDLMQHFHQTSPKKERIP